MKGLGLRLNLSIVGIARRFLINKESEMRFCVTE
jgi:hypothetical protein